MNNLALILFFVTNLSINTGTPAISGCYWSVDRNITATIARGRSNTLTIQFSGIEKYSKKYPLFPLDTEFIQWFLTYFGDINFKEQMKDKESAYSIKARDLLAGKINEPEKMIKKWHETFFRLKNRAEAIFLMSDISTKEKFLYYINVTDKKKPGIGLFSDGVLYVGLFWNMLLIKYDDDYFHMARISE